MTIEVIYNYPILSLSLLSLYNDVMLDNKAYC